MRPRKSLNARYWIEKLRLEPHPEGGYFRQTYKSELMIAPAPARSLTRSDRRTGQTKIAKGATLEWGTQGFGARAASTAIYFLLEDENFSAFHRLRSDEMWHFYAGSPLVVHVIDQAREYSSILLGSDLEQGEVFQAVVKAGCWFASEVKDQRSWALVGCTVAPGFEFEDFELAKRRELLRIHPQHRELIERLTRQ
jgi:predicted cupin superfamily sugar epimerase